MTLQTPTIEAPGKLKHAEPVDLATFLSRENDQVSEYIHVIFDPDSDDVRQRVALFRNVGEAGGTDWIGTEIEPARFSFIGPRKPTGFFLTDTDAETLMTLLDRMRVERSDALLTFDWWEENNSPMIEDHGLDQESLFVAYSTDSGRDNKVELGGVYANDTQMMAKF